MLLISHSLWIKRQGKADIAQVKRGYVLEYNHKLKEKKPMKLKPYQITAGIAALATVAMVFGAVEIAQAQVDPFNEITARGDEFTDFLFNNLAKILIAVLFFVYVIKYLVTRKMDMNEVFTFLVGSVLLGLGTTAIQFFMGN